MVSEQERGDENGLINNAGVNLMATDEAGPKGRGESAVRKDTLPAPFLIGTFGVNRIMVEAEDVPDCSEEFWLLTARRVGI